MMVLLIVPDKYVTGLQTMTIEFAWYIKKMVVWLQLEKQVSLWQKGNTLDLLTEMII